MTPKKVTTDATKAKLPRPKKRKPKQLAEVGTMPAPDFRPVPCMDWPADSLPSGDPTYTFTPSYIPPTVEPYPWPVRFLNWVDDAQFWVRQRVANGLRRMAARIAP